MSKRTRREIIDTLIRDGNILETKGRGERTYMIIEYAGQKYWIDNPWGERPKITQLSQNLTKS